MSDAFPNKPSFTVTERARRFAIDERDAVTLAIAATTSDGEAVPAGTVGTVVAVWGEAEAYEVEFDEPYTGLVTALPEMIREHRPSRG